MRALAIAKEAIALDRARPVQNRTRLELQFLPAALEVVETPPHPAARALAWTLMVLVAACVAWAWFGQTDVVAVADGRTLPSGKSKVVQAAEPGVVRAIHVRDGAEVRAGDLLIEFDPTNAAAERERLNQELMTAAVTAARLRALLADPRPEEVLTGFSPPEEADPSLVRAMRNLLVSEAVEHSAKLSQIDDEIRRKRVEREAAVATIDRLDQSIPLLAERVTARRTLANQGYGSRLVYLEVQQQLVEAEQDRVIQRHRVAEIEAGIVVLESQYKGVQAEFRRTHSAELADAERRAVSLQQELLKADQRRALQSLSSPIDGTVQQLAVNTIGGVVTAAQALLVVVPKDDGLEVEAKVLNRDIGFVRPGLTAQVKIETFNFTRYGLVSGEVVHVSSDAIVDEKIGPVYAARIRLDRASMTIEGREVALGPGMNASVEILIYRRRIIEYLLSPLLRVQHEAFRER